MNLPFDLPCRGFKSFKDHLPLDQNVKPEVIVCSRKIDTVIITQQQIVIAPFYNSNVGSKAQSKVLRL